MKAFVMVAAAAAIAWLFTVLVMPFFIPILKKIKAGQSIRAEGPRSHLAKEGTPTMGGLVIIAAVTVSCLIIPGMLIDRLIILFAFGAYGFLGFLDDFVKVSMKRNLGLRAWQKLVLQILIAVGITLYHLRVSSSTAIRVPFTENYLDLGVWYIPFVTFVIVAMANSVNLTDGLDGLATGVTLIVAAFLTLFGTLLYFRSAPIFCAALTGACLGFLMFNRYPARVFMGDTGSMALGGGIAAAAVMMRLELIIPIAGAIYVAEALSVILQVTWFRLSGGKRLFRMSPLHHHFEMSGWSETKVVRTFSSFTLLFCLIAWVALKI